ncbi:MAG: hypothetical protein M3Y91_18980 [Actinomycetota bacterium]|nr:hypothetical protein [Actinomycetota bacterium]
MGIRSPGSFPSDPEPWTNSSSKAVTEAAGDLLDVAEDMGLPAPSAVLPSAALADLRADER